MRLFTSSLDYNIKLSHGRITQALNCSFLLRLAEGLLIIFCGGIAQLLQRRRLVIERLLVQFSNRVFVIGYLEKKLYAKKFFDVDETKHSSRRLNTKQMILLQLFG